MIFAPAENERIVTGMTEYIEREAGIKAIENDLPEQVHYSREDAVDCIRYIPAADVAPVRHGRWENKNGLYSCSEYGMTCPYDA